MFLKKWPNFAIKLWGLIKSGLNKIKLDNSKEEIRSPDELFNTGEIFNATDEELDNILRELSTQGILNENFRHRAIIRGLVVDSIKNQRHIDSIESRNHWFTAIIIALTVVNIFLYIKNSIIQEEYTKILIRPILTEEERNKREAKKYCEGNPDGSWPNIYGEMLDCSRVFEILDKQ